MRPQIPFLRLFSAALVLMGVLCIQPGDARANEYPFTLEGDGMTLVVQRETGDGSTLEGTMQVTTSKAWPFTVTLRQDPAGGMTGNGEVRAGQRRVPFTLTSRQPGVAAVTLAGKVYQIRLRQSPPTPSVNPGGVVTPPTQPGTRTPVEKTVRLKATKIIDKRELKQPFHSHTLFVPEGWTLTGGTWHPQTNQYFQVFPSMFLSVLAKDGREVRVTPTIAAVDSHENGRRAPEGSAVKGMIAATFPGRAGTFPPQVDYQRVAGDMRDKLVPMLWPQAQQVRMTNTVRLPEYRQLLERMIANNKRMMAQHQATANSAGLPIRYFSDCDVIGLEGEFVLGGKTYEFLRIVGLIWGGNQTQYSQDIIWNTTYDVTFKAPKGQLAANLGLLRTVAHSIRGTDTWNQAMFTRLKALAKMHRGIAEDNRKHWQKMNQIQTTSSQQIQQIINQGYANRVKIQDATHAKVIRAIKETGIISLPGSNAPLEVSIHWNKIWGNESNLIFSNDPTFDPGPGYNILQPRN